MKTKMILFLGIICTVMACQQKEAKNYECKEYSTECELQKDRILILPIAIDSTFVDAYGDKVICGQTKYGYQWYVVGTKACVLVPVRIPVCISRGSAGDCTYDDYPSPERIQKLFWARDKVRIDTVNLSHVIKGLTKFAIIISGPNEISRPEISSIDLALAK